MTRSERLSKADSGAAPSAWIVRSEVLHQRLFPLRYRFRYRVVGCLIDIDRLEDLQHQHRLFSVNRFNVFSVHTQDHARRDGSAWRPWIEARMAEMGISLDGGRIRLLMIPRILGYAFNPLSVWYCEDRNGQVRAVLLEVRNTFGEHHHYALHADGAAMSWPVLAEKPKRFHVSPFIGMDATYRFRITNPDNGPRIGIREYQGVNLMLIASQKGALLPFNDRQILRAFLRMPLASVKIMFLIHWQALLIWLRGGKYFSRPERPKEEIS
jgi:DUF1365 family protein